MFITYWALYCSGRVLNNENMGLYNNLIDTNEINTEVFCIS